MCRLFGMAGGPEPVEVRFWLLQAPDLLVAAEPPGARRHRAGLVRPRRPPARLQAAARRPGRPHVRPPGPARPLAHVRRPPPLRDDGHAGGEEHASVRAGGAAVRPQRDGRGPRRARARARARPAARPRGHRLRARVRAHHPRGRALRRRRRRDRLGRPLDRGQPADARHQPRPDRGDRACGRCATPTSTTCTCCDARPAGPAARTRSNMGAGAASAPRPSSWQSARRWSSPPSRWTTTRAGRDSPPASSCTSTARSGSTAGGCSTTARRNRCSLAELEGRAAAAQRA